MYLRNDKINTFLKIAMCELPSSFSYTTLAFCPIQDNNKQIGRYSLGSTPPIEKRYLTQNMFLYPNLVSYLYTRVVCT